MLLSAELSQAPRVSLPKRALCVLLTVALAATMTVLPTAQPKAYAANTKSVTVTYAQTDARGMLKLINDFRASSPKCWNADNKTQKTYSGLKALTYDYELEKVAMLRAAELVLRCEHTRPNGEHYSTAFSQLPLTGGAENIAWGTGTMATMKAIFEGWREDNKKYEGQGHRRNMLDSKYTSVAVAHVMHGGKSYWVQSFGSNVVSSKATPAVDATQTVAISMDKTPASAVNPTVANAKPAKVTGLKAKAGKKKLVMTWRAPAANAQGYVIWISTNKKFTKGLKKYTLKDGAYAKMTIGGLKSKKTYYVKIRSYNKVKKNGKKVTQYSKWSAVKKVKVK